MGNHFYNVGTEDITKKKKSPNVLIEIVVVKQFHPSVSPHHIVTTVSVSHSSTVYLTMPLAHIRPEFNYVVQQY